MRAYAVVLLFVLSGCIAGHPSVPGGAAVPSAGPLLTFASSIALPDATAVGEPNIIAAQDGKTLYATAPAGLVGEPNYHRTQAFIWKSTDAGATWKTIQKPTAAPAGAPLFCSCDSDVVLSKTGILYESDLWIAAAGVATNFVVTSSMDGGATWNNGNPLPAVTASVDRQWLLPGEGKTVFLAYANFLALVSPPKVGAAPAAGLWISRSDDAGMTWGAFTEVAPITDTFPLIGKPRMTPDGTILFPYNRVSNTAKDPFNETSDIDVAVSKDHGASWREVKVATEPAGTGGLWSTQLDVGADGTAAVVWMAQADKDNRVIRAAFSHDRGETWTPPVTASDATGNHVLPWVAARPDGTFAVAYYGTDVRGWNGGLPASTRWDAWVSIVDPSATAASKPIRASGAPVKMGSLCTSGSACGKDRELLDYVSIAADTKGLVHFAYSASPKAGSAIVNVANQIAP